MSELVVTDSPNFGVVLPAVDRVTEENHERPAATRCRPAGASKSFLPAGGYLSEVRVGAGGGGPWRAAAATLVTSDETEVSGVVTVVEAGSAGPARREGAVLKTLMRRPQPAGRTQRAP
ncbi:hypothetical protein O7623_14485 [Solwaraspora sp. WMMD791]|uniref:hypothetical protein n=1 Tax=Solwaraspora sp. WMMD791 TaxID=3016086 RepID=UPI00249B8CF6|nr:hypothetical protein [Solwaraspora sp. WMMD791]WFE30313.1 hypothetical protein O7623_14485 [Solwaraspora sp. WMMD791]